LGKSNGSRTESNDKRDEEKVSDGITVDAIHKAFKQASQGSFKEFIALSSEELVSSDFSGSSASVTIDLPLTQVNGQLAQVFGWYDNEWGYSCRMKDFLLRCG
jgi:glyceraldehyde 3-phosphate dehydrogenase